jgi:hypothetical protein
VKIRNKDNGVEAEVGDTLAGVLVAGGGWEKVEEEAPAKPVRKRAAKKPVEEPVSTEE